MEDKYHFNHINPNKKNQVFTPEERVKFINKVVDKYDNVKVLSYDCLTIELAETLKACAIVKGLRNSIDFEDEMYQAEYNYNVNNSIETIFLISDENLVNVSSTKVKELAANKDNIKDIIPIEIYDEVVAKLYKKK